MKWWRFSQQTQEWRDEAREHIGNGVAVRAIAIVTVVYLSATVALGIYWSREPALFSITAATAKQLPGVQQPAPGSSTTAVLIEIISTLLDKPGGFVNNDIAPPGMWLDNMPNWELGVLAQTRDLSRVLRESWSRQDASASEDQDLGRVEPRLNFSANSWVLPASESQYREATEYLRSYLQRLQGPAEQRAHFFASASNLNLWLLQVSVRLGDLSQRLSACVKPRDNPALPADEATDRPATPASKIDDVFYVARGNTWALIQLLRAVEIDFGDVLRKNNAQAALHQIVHDLEATQEPVYSPLILNGSGFGILANHSLVMASYIARANAALINLRNSLAQESNQ